MNEFIFERKKFKILKVRTVATEISTFLTNDILYQIIPKQMLEKIIIAGVTFVNFFKVSSSVQNWREPFKDSPYRFDYG